MEPIVLEPIELSLTSINNQHSICLNNDKGWLIPRDCNVMGIIMEYPPELDEIRLVIGNSVICTFDRHMMDDLKTFPIYTSLSEYMYCRLEFAYNKEWLLEREEYTYEDEYVENVWFNDEVEVFDGCEYHVGKRVIRKDVPTGNKKRVVTRGVPVSVPKIVFNIEANGNLTQKEVPIKQKIILTGLDAGYKEHLKNKFNMKQIDENTGIVTNMLYYAGGMAGLRFVF
jgi:hypothetical protein